MTQAYITQPLILDLIPLRLPEAESAMLPIQSERANIDPENQSLLLIPGEPSEMLVRLANLSSRPLQINFELSGDFPSQWCQIGTEGNILAPAERMEAVLYFQIPIDFFEAQQAIRIGQVLKLDYSARLNVYGSYPGTTPQLLEIANFNLYIRPQTRYLEFLPEFYRDVDFIGRFLKIFEATLEPDIQILANLWAYLDPRTAPRGMLDFLAHWVGWRVQPYLSLEQQRALIFNALEIYSWRGTRRGLRLYLHLATNLPLDDHLPNEDDKHIGIYEFFSDGFVLGGTSIGQDAILGGVRPFHFKVCLRPEVSNSIDEELIKTIIEQEKPAFCTYDLLIQNR